MSVYHAPAADLSDYDEQIDQLREAVDALEELIGTQEAGAFEASDAVDDAEDDDDRKAAKVAEAKYALSAHFLRVARLKLAEVVEMLDEQVRLQDA